MTGIDPFYLIITLGTMLVSRWVGHMLHKRFREYSAIPIRYSGAEIAELMLQQNGITDVKVISTPGQLTDHYNPMNKTVNLSEAVCHERNVSAAAVAAHECGHAVQHATGYAALKARSAIVPAVSITSKITMPILMIGLFLAASGLTWPLLIGIVLFSLSTLFSVITLPVEFDASSRALKWLEASGFTDQIGHEKAKNALFWAAMTYTVAAIASIGQLLYFIVRYMGARR